MFKIGTRYSFVIYGRVIIGTVVDHQGNWVWLDEANEPGNQVIMSLVINLEHVWFYSETLPPEPRDEDNEAV